MGTWSWVYEGFDPKTERLREALCTLGNSYFCTRGAGEESADDDIHYPGTYLAGGYNRVKTHIAGETVENEDLVNMPNWLPLNFRIAGGKWFDLRDVDILEYRQVLEMDKGILRRTFRFRDDRGRATWVESRRLVHMRLPHYAALEMRLVPENWTGEIAFRSALDGRVINNNVARYRELERRHLEPIETREVDEETIHLRMRTNQSCLQVAQTARTRVYRNRERLRLERHLRSEPVWIAQEFQLDAVEKSEIRIGKIVSMFTSRDVATSECGLESRKWAGRAGSFKELSQSNEIAWESLWRRFDLEFEHEDREQSDRISGIIHLYLFHLLQTVSINSMALDLDVGVPSRGWHGEAYRGHILWDEIFVFPLINLRLPEITREILLYRFRRLDEARANARRSGFQGAMFPWQSGSDGREESQRIHLNPRSGRWIPDNSNLQRHVNAAIAYNVHQYYQVTKDTEFMIFYGAEMILEIARFWASIATYNPDHDRYEILGVMGPDEFHEAYPGAEKPGLDNNAYTNVMAVWVLNTALEMLRILSEDALVEVKRKIGLEDAEIALWDDIRHKMRLVFHDDGIISQFEGYGNLKEFDWEAYRKKYGDIHRLDRILESENDTPNRYKLSKQADVLMLFYLFSSEELAEIFEQLGYPFDYETIPRNIQYYIDRASHGSTLSWVVHSWVITRSNRARSWELFRMALRSDVADIQGGTTPEGIHLGAMAGTIDLLQRGYTGIVTRGEVLWLNPCLPEGLRHLKMRIRYQGHSLTLRITPDRLTVTARRSAEKPIRIGFRDKVFELEEGSSREFDLQAEAPHRQCPD